MSPGGPWRTWRSPFARSGRVAWQPPMTTSFGEAAPAGTETSGGAYAPQMLGD